MSIKEFLNQAFYLDRLIQANKDELERLRSVAESISSPDLSTERVQGGERSDKVANTVTKIVDLEREIQAENDRYIRARIDIRRVIDAVDKPKLKLILQERYLNFKKWEQIQDIVEVVDLRYLFRLHNTALDEAIKKNPTDHCFK
ncbi:MAG: DUF1492 domain-containing protein [Candidatus Fimivivens sp.]|nr:DUF1492 domain-containing protein [Candidatus Fimivivens sp.]